MCGNLKRRARRTVPRLCTFVKTLCTFMNMRTLPSKGGSIAALAKILNLASKDDFILAIAWLLGALTNGPYPIAAFVGEQGTAKSTSTRLLRKLVDPNKANLRSLPREERDLAVTGRNSHVLTFDNLSGLSAWVSDALARVATGGGFSCRALYSNGDEFIFDGPAPHHHERDRGLRHTPGPA